MSTVNGAKRKLNPVDDFDEIYRKNFKIICYYLSRRCDVALAEELTQEAFLKAWVARYTYEDKGYTPKAWILKIAINLLTSYNRRLFRFAFSIDEPKGESEDAWDFPDLRDELQWAEEDENWNWLMSKLSKKFAYVMTQRYREGRANNEIGRELDIPERSVSSRIYTAKQILMPYLKELYGDEFKIPVREPNREAKKRERNGQHLEPQRNEMSVLQPAQTPNVQKQSA